MDVNAFESETLKMTSDDVSYYRRVLDAMTDDDPARVELSELVEAAEKAAERRAAALSRLAESDADLI